MTSNESNNRAMLICRISDRKQRDGTSLDTQEEAQRDYARRSGLEVVAVESFQESAKDSELRLQFHAAIKRAVREGIPNLVFYVYDRIARNFTDGEMLEKLVRSGTIVLHLARSGEVLHKKSDDSAFMLFDFNILQAKAENRARARRTIDGMTALCEAGRFPSRPPTFYWQVSALDEKGRLKRGQGHVAGPTPEGRALLKRQAALRIGGASMEMIRQTCIREGLVPVSFLPRYRISLIHRLLTNCFYAALPQPHDGFVSQFIWQERWYEGKHEPVYTAHEWEFLQASFKSTTPIRKRKHEGLFTDALRLICADPNCGCLVTYAPKKKASGREYAYYRCSNGKRVHDEQVNVIESDVLAQLGTAVDAIALTEDIAEAIARALNETHRQATTAKREAVLIYKAQLAELDTKENRLVDAFADGTLTADLFKRQQARVRDERDALFEKLQVAESVADDAYLVTAERTLELAKCAKTLWEARTPEERRDFLSKLVCNPRLDGRTVRFDLKKPFDALARLRSGIATMEPGTQRAPTSPSRPSSHIALSATADWRPQRESNPRYRRERPMS